MTWLRFGAGLALCLLLCAGASAQDGAEPAPIDPSVASIESADLLGEPASMPSFPPGPGELEAPEGKDWILLSSGEWLFGSLTKVRDGKLTFNSDKLGSRVIDLSHVQELSAPNDYTYVFGEALDEVSGPGRLIGDQVVVVTAQGPRAFPRGDLLSIVPFAESELDLWSLKVDLSVTGTTGNSEQVTGTLKIDTVREDSLTRLAMGYLGTYGLSDGEEIAKSHLGTLQIDLFVSRRFYVIPALARAYYDRFQNIDIRATAGPGAGYYIFREPDTKWAVEGVIAYTYTEYRRAPPGDDRVEKGATLRLATRAEFDITDSISFAGRYESFLGLADIQDTFHHAEANLYIDLIDDTLKLSLGYVWDRQERTVRTTEGKLPHKDDMRYSVGLVLDL